MKRDREHERLLLPWDPPLPASIGGQLPPIPALWERAKMMFERVIGHIGSASRFSRRGRVTRPEKKDLVGWLYPVEKLVRSCLIVRALNFLMMTVEGRKLMRDTPKMAMPEKPKPPGAKHDPYVETIPHPGWSTIARHRLALARQEQRACIRTAERATRDPHDPASWSCPFRIVGWKFADEPREWTPPKAPSPVRISLIEPPEESPLFHDRRDGPGGQQKDSLALRLARRVEALSRAIANPERSARTLARFLARLPREALQGLVETSGICKAGWKHGFDDNRLCAAHVRRAATVLLYEPHLESDSLKHNSWLYSPRRPTPAGMRAFVQCHGIVIPAAAKRRAGMTNHFDRHSGVRALPTRHSLFPAQRTQNGISSSKSAPREKSSFSPLPPLPFAPAPRAGARS